VLAVLEGFLMDIEQDVFLSWETGLPNQSADGASPLASEAARADCLRNQESAKPV
jgi:hypothetical protein